MRDYGQFNIGTSINYEKDPAPKISWPSQKDLEVKDQQATFGISVDQRPATQSMLNDSTHQPTRLDLDFNTLAKRKVSPIQQAIDLNDGPNLSYKVI